jgi:hypothetical protein
MARPSGNPGDAAEGASIAHKAVDLLEQALTKVPAAHPGHKSIMSAISSLNKSFPPEAASPGVGKQALIQLLAQMQKGSPMAALGGGAGAGAGAGAPGGAPPMPMPSPEGGGAPPAPPM